MGQSEQFEVSIMGTKWEIKGFFRENFELWKVKMEAILMGYRGIHVRDLNPVGTVYKYQKQKLVNRRGCSIHIR
ncbi:unnamed protein product [Trifolium pratense]|uniref:Uncharacterized protein n=1 Tax=Trifolium pratense TaxID=57577 RepID=A0ACB0KQ07_TRIPR|nr:unnamed protein product [Trifolium pratense]